MRSYIVLAAVFAFTAMPGGMAAKADEPSVLDVSVVANADGTYGFSATVAHRDEGWKHYANKWDIVTPDNKVIGERLLFHPHVDEQPFVRSLGRVAVPIGVTEVTVRAYCNITGAGSRTFTVKLPPRK